MVDVVEVCRGDLIVVVWVEDFRTVLRMKQYLGRNEEFIFMGCCKNQWTMV